MKEIIEKYKKGELRVKDCIHRIQFGDGDVIRNVFNDKSSGTRVEECVTDKPIGINDCNTNLGYTNPNYFVATCAALDKEIAAMEKQPEYEFAKVDAGESWSVWEYLKEYEEQEVDWFVEINGRHVQCIEWFNVCERIRAGEQLYRRVEITPEQKREREVEELGHKLLITYEHCNGTWQDKFEAVARDAIEWMESKK